MDLTLSEYEYNNEMVIAIEPREKVFLYVLVVFIGGLYRIIHRMTWYQVPVLSTRRKTQESKDTLDGKITRDYKPNAI